MPRIRQLTDRDEIAAVLRRDPAVNIYALGDLDDFFWPRTTWFGLEDDGGLAAVALLYRSEPLATLLVLDGSVAGRSLLEALPGRVPDRVYAHLALPLVDPLPATVSLATPVLHDKMVLDDPRAVTEADTAEGVSLDTTDLGEIRALYARSYPDNWFDARMLATGQYVGIRRGGALVAVAGVHVFAPGHGVAALGNITVAPEHRGCGLGRAVTAACCQRLVRHVTRIGLNVKADNQAAIECYRRLGFVRVRQYVEGVAWLAAGEPAGRPSHA